MTAIRQLFSPSSQKREAMELYIALVHQSRKPFFYTDCAVPDTLDGRFDVILLHVFMVMNYLRDNRELSRLLLESFYDDMDRSLREMGVGDMGVSKRMKKMSQAAYGRLEAYTQAYGNDAVMREALRRNVYRGADVSSQALDALQQYMREYKSPIAPQ